jgi:class 3 adenylate cyclase
MSGKIDERVLDERLGALEGARAWSPRVMSKLENYIRTPEDVQLFRTNPIRFATEKHVAEGEAIDLFLHGTAVGLFEMDWALICPMCSCVVESFRSLQSVENHFRCTFCHTDYEASLDDYIAVTFTIASSVRDIAFHHPEDLPPRDYFFIFKATPDGLVPEGVEMPPAGTRWVDVMSSMTLGFAALPPGRTTRIEVDAPEGTLFGVDADTNAHFYVAVDGSPVANPQTVTIRYADEVCEPPAGQVSPGKVTFQIENVTNRTGRFAIASFPPGAQRMMLTFAPFLSAKRLLTTQTFRDLFRSEVIRATEGIGVRDITLLFTDLQGSTALYDHIGDLNAFALVQRHFERLRDVTVRHGGTIIKTIGDAIMAAFLDPAEAVTAATAMLREMDAFNRNLPDKALILKIGVHRGAAITVTQNERLDYFGQTVNIAARVQNLAQAEEICLTTEVLEAPGVREMLAPFAVERQVMQLKGIMQHVPVFRVTPRVAVAGVGTLSGDAPAARSNE